MAYFREGGDETSGTGRRREGPEHSKDPRSDDTHRGEVSVRFTPDVVSKSDETSDRDDEDPLRPDYKGVTRSWSSTRDERRGWVSEPITGVLSGHTFHWETGDVDHAPSGKDDSPFVSLLRLS